MGKGMCGVCVFEYFLHKKNLKHRLSNLSLVIARKQEEQEMNPDLTDQSQCYGVALRNEGLFITTVIITQVPL